MSLRLEQKSYFVRRLWPIWFAMVVKADLQFDLPPNISDLASSDLVQVFRMQSSKPARYLVEWLVPESGLSWSAVKMSLQFGHEKSGGLTDTVIVWTSHVRFSSTPIP